MPLLVELGSLRDLRVGHPSGGVDAVFGEDAGDSRAGDQELSGDGSDIADIEVPINEEVGFTCSQLSGSSTRSAAGMLRFL